MEYLTISQVSRKYGVTPRMLRYYEKLGLIKAGRREDYAYRIYDEEAVRRLQQILIFRKLRLSLKEIAVLLGDTIADKEYRRELYVTGQSIYRCSALFDCRRNGNGKNTGTAISPLLQNIRACRINSAWLILQRVTRLENPAYSYAAKRVLLTGGGYSVCCLLNYTNLEIYFAIALVSRTGTYK